MPKIIDKTCYECKENKIKTKLDSLRKIYLCEPCAKSNKYTLIYKTYVKRDYFIDPDILLELDCETYNRRIRGNDTTLFRLCDILDVFCDEYDVDRNSKNAIYKKQKELKHNHEKKKVERAELAKTKKQQKEQFRYNKLQQSLHEYKLELRNDSKLCTGYINGTIKDWSVDQIVERMCQMKYLFDYCNMNHYLEKAHREQREELKAGYFPDCSAFDHAEWMALNKYGKYPQNWPWI